MTRRRGLLLAVGAVVALVAVLVLSGPQADHFDRPPLDPRGTGPEGTAALVELLRQEGAVVRLGGLPDARDDVVLQFRETLSGDALRTTSEWVRRGGTLVTTDPLGAFAVEPTGVPFPAGNPQGCTLRALRDAPVLVPRPLALFPSEGASACYVDGPNAAVVATRWGAGITVSVSGPENLTNGAIAAGDNAVFARALLVPHRGARVRVLDPHRLLSDDEQIGDGTVVGSLPLRAHQSLTTALIAAVVWGLVSGRRLGRPVPEELPVPLPASNLVLAAGNLLDRNGVPSDAAERLRRRARRDIGIAVGLGADPPVDFLMHTIAARFPVDAALVRAALTDPVVDEAGLVAVTAAIDRLRSELSP